MIKRIAVALALVLCLGTAQAQQVNPTNGMAVTAGSIGATLTAIKASPGRVYGWTFYNPNATAAYVQFFNAAPGAVTLGTTAPFMSVGLAPTQANLVSLPLGIRFSTAITIAVTTTRAGLTAPGATVDFDLFTY